MNMRKSLTLPGLLGAALAAGLLFTACPMDGGGDGGPSPADLPGLPSATPYVASRAEALALLTALRPAFVSVKNDVEYRVWQAQTGSTDGRWDITDATSLTGITVRSKGRLVTAPVSLMDPDSNSIPKKGDRGTMSSSVETSADITADTTESGVLVYGGSRVVEKERATASYTITDVVVLGGIPTGFTVLMSGSGEFTALYTLTASSGGKGGKIILNLRMGGSISNVEYSYPGDGESPDMPYTYSGSLNVYGANDEAQYTLDITNMATYQQAMAYFD
jgi:hypothetical protein